MSKFKLRSSTEVMDPVRIFFDDSQEDFIELRPSMSRKDFYKIAGKTSSSEAEDRILVSVDNLFTALVLDWSVTDAKDKKVPVSLEALEQLPMEYQTWIDRKVQDHFADFANIALPDAEGKSETPQETSDSDVV